MRSILLDTSALFASLDADDPNSSRAQEFLRHQGAQYIVPDTVFSEAMTLIKIHLGIDLAIKTGRALLAGTPFRLHRLSHEEAQATWTVFCKYTDKEWSYTDCSVLALARERNITQVFSFDHHFDQMSSLGLQRVP